jgi:hypothetical protein
MDEFGYSEADDAAFSAFDLGALEAEAATKVEARLSAEAARTARYSTAHAAPCRRHIEYPGGGGYCRNCCNAAEETHRAEEAVHRSAAAPRARPPLQSTGNRAPLANAAAGKRPLSPAARACTSDRKTARSSDPYDDPNYEPPSSRMFCEFCEGITEEFCYEECRGKYSMYECEACPVCAESGRKLRDQNHRDSNRHKQTESYCFYHRVDDDRMRLLDSNLVRTRLNCQYIRIYPVMYFVSATRVKEPIV